MNCRHALTQHSQTVTLKILLQRISKADNPSEIHWQLSELQSRAHPGTRQTPIIPFALFAIDNNDSIRIPQSTNE